MLLFIIFIAIIMFNGICIYMYIILKLWICVTVEDTDLSIFYLYLAMYPISFWQHKIQYQM